MSTTINRQMPIFLSSLFFGILGLAINLNVHAQSALDDVLRGGLLLQRLLLRRQHGLLVVSYAPCSRCLHSYLRLAHWADLNICGTRP